MRTLAAERGRAERGVDRSMSAITRAPSLHRCAPWATESIPVRGQHQRLAFGWSLRVAERVCEVKLYGRPGDAETGRDLLVGATGRSQRQHLAFARAYLAAGRTAEHMSPRSPARFSPMRKNGGLSDTLLDLTHLTAPVRVGGPEFPKVGRSREFLCSLR